MIYFQSERLIARDFLFEDLATFTAYRNHPDIARYQSWSQYTLDDAKALFGQQQETVFNTPDTWYQVALISAETNQLIGDLALHFLDEQQVEIGFTLAPDHQKQGYATEALHHMINYLFQHKNKHRLVAMIDTNNQPAATLLGRVGFRKEAHFRQNIFFKGQWGDEYLFALLQQEWLNVQP